MPAETERRYRLCGYWDDRLLDDVVLRAATAPGRIALCHGDQRMTYGELTDRVDRAARAFAGAGLRPGDRVVVRLPNSPELIVTVLAMLRTGVAPVLMVPSLGRRELDHIVAATGARGVVLARRPGGDAERACRELREKAGVRFAALLAGKTRGDMPEGATDLAALLVGEPPAPAPAPYSRSAADVAFFLLSGGTTGLPKAIPRTHRDYVHNIEISARLTRLGPETRYLAALPITHNFVLGCPGVLGTLAAGGRVVIGTPAARTIAEVIERERITVTALVPGLAKSLADARADLSSLRVLQVGGARLYEPDARRLRDRLGPGRLQQVFGMAEGLLNFTRLDDPDDVVAATQGRPASPGDEWAIVGTDGKPAGPGESGELLVRGPYTIRGYTGAPEANAEAFTADGFYRTGDVVRLHPSGNFVVEGRRREFVNRGGEKIAVSEIETLLADHPHLREAVAVPAPHDFFGEVVCLFAVAAGPGLPTLQEIRRYLKGRGLAPHGLPERLEPLDRVPVTAVGKPDRAALARAAARTPVQPRAKAPRRHSEPTN